jgi:hypothetical protein
MHNVVSDSKIKGIGVIIGSYSILAAILVEKDQNFRSV